MEYRASQPLEVLSMEQRWRAHRESATDQFNAHLAADSFLSCLSYLELWYDVDLHRHTIAAVLEQVRLLSKRRIRQGEKASFDCYWSSAGSHEEINVLSPRRDVSLQ